MAKRAARLQRTGSSKLTFKLLSMCFAAIIWAAHLTFVYGAATIACIPETPAKIFGMNAPAFFVLAFTVLALGAIVAGSLWPSRDAGNEATKMHEERQFELRVTRWIAALSAFGVLWGGAAAFFVSPCVALR
jgi:hypothetical protein